MDYFDRAALIALDGALNDQAGTAHTDPADEVGLSRARDTAPLAYDVIRFHIWWETVKNDPRPEGCPTTLGGRALEYTGE